MDVPVLLLAYNRPKHTEEVLKRLKDCGAKRVFVFADGPKNEQDQKSTNEVQSLFSKQGSIIEFSKISEVNLGCKLGVTTGIDWFFEHVDEGIILEDDCLPNRSFFQFAEDMLSRYRNEENVMMISGNNPLGNWKTNGGHFFSRIGPSWGWATWKNRWNAFDVELPNLKSFVDSSGFEKAFGLTDLAQSRKELTLRSLKREIDTWDYQWNAHILMNEGLAAIPTKNLIKNIGFDDSSTHLTTKPDWISNEVSDAIIEVGSRKVTADIEYEMEWHLAKLSNQRGLPSSGHFKNIADQQNTKLRIVIVNSTDIGGGAEKIAFELLQNLNSFGHDTTLLVEIKKSNLESVVQINDWETQFKELKPDLIHVHNLHGTSIPLDGLIRLSNEFPTLFTLHDSWLATGSTEHPFCIEPTNLNLIDLKKWNHVFQERTGLVQSSKTRFSAPSQWMRELFFRRHGIRPYSVPNAASNIIEKEIEMPSKRYMIFVANRPETNPYKDFITLKTAWLKVNHELGANGLDLVVVGGNSQIEKHGQFNIYHVAKCEAEVIRAYMTKAEILVQASLQDNAPLTILEAHAYQTTVIGSLVGGIPELLSNDEKQWLFEVENSDQLSSYIIEAVSSDKAAIPEHPSTETIVETYLGHYYDLTCA